MNAEIQSASVSWIIFWKKYKLLIKFNVIKFVHICQAFFVYVCITKFIIIEFYMLYVVLVELLRFRRAVCGWSWTALHGYILIVNIWVSCFEFWTCLSSKMKIAFLLSKNCIHILRVAFQRKFVFFLHSIGKSLSLMVMSMARILLVFTLVI